MQAIAARSCRSSCLRHCVSFIKGCRQRMSIKMDVMSLRRRDFDIGPEPSGKAAGRVFWITGLSGAGKTKSASDCGIDYAPTDARPSFWTATGCAARSRRTSATPSKIGDDRRCGTAVYASFWPNRGSMSSARPFPCSTKFNDGTEPTSPDILKSTCGSRCPRSSDGSEGNLHPRPQRRGEERCRHRYCRRGAGSAQSGARQSRLARP